MKFIRNCQIVLLFFILGCAQSPTPRILSQEYNFPLVDGTLLKLVQHNDTLYDYESPVDSPSVPHTLTSHLIMNVDSAGEFTIFKIKIPGTNSRLNKGYSMVVLKNINSKQLSYSDHYFNLTRQQLDSIDVSSLPLEDMSFSTYFSDSYLKELSALKKVTTVDAMKEIINAIPHNNFKAGKISYTAEELNKACIEKGYNPVGAARLVDSLLKDNVAKHELAKRSRDK